MEVLVNIMDFGGFVSYTVSGYKCHPFGTQAIKEAITVAASELDMPQSLSLRPGRRGIRRTVLKGKDGKFAVVYSAFIGLSEPNANRVGSFLAIGIATQKELDCNSNDVGPVLHNLLSDLVERVSDGYRFTSELGVDVINAFLRENSPILEDLQSSYSPSGRTIFSSPQAERSTLFLSDDRTALTIVFNRICSYLPYGTDFFLFDTSASADVKGAHHEFRVAAWPIRAAQADIRPPAFSATTAQQPTLQLQEHSPRSNSIEKSLDAEQIREVERIIDRRDDKIKRIISELQSAHTRWKYISLFAISATTPLLIIITYFLYTWHSETTTQFKSIQQQLQANRHKDPVRPADSETPADVEAAAPKSPPSKK